MSEKIETGTYIRTAVLVIALLNQILSAAGRSVLPITDEQIETIISTVFTVGAALAAWWKNNSFTSAAIRADGFLKKLKEESNRED